MTKPHGKPDEKPGDKSRDKRPGKPPLDVTYPADMQGQRKEPDGLGRDVPKPADAPQDSVSMDVGKAKRVTPKN